MTVDRHDLEERRDQALRDLVDLDRQLDEEELTPETAAVLRLRYEREAAAALAELEAATTRVQRMRASERAIAAARTRRRASPGRLLVYGAGVLALVAAGVLLPGYVLGRPAGGFVSGNEALQNPNGTFRGSASTPAPKRDLAAVTDQEMEAVVAANPEVIGMRLALANRYTAKGRYDLAVVHYRKVLEQDPGNVEGKAHLGWLLLQIGKPAEAARLVDSALRADAALLDALWFKANIQLYGLGNVEAARRVLDTMAKQPGVSAAVREQIATLRAEADRRGGSSR